MATETGWSAATRAAFLGELARTASIAGAAAKAKVSEDAAHGERRRSAAFRAAWARALDDGHAALEAMLLERALATLKGVKAEAGLAMTERGALAVVAQHRAEQRAAKAAKPAVSRKKADEAAKGELDRLFAEMKERMAADGLGD